LSKFLSRMIPQAECVRIIIRSEIPVDRRNVNLKNRHRGFIPLTAMHGAISRVGTSRNQRRDRSRFSRSYKQRQIKTADQ
jgi:hypothetical protein